MTKSSSTLTAIPEMCFWRHPTGSCLRVLLGLSYGPSSTRARVHANRPRDILRGRRCACRGDGEFIVRTSPLGCCRDHAPETNLPARECGRLFQRTGSGDARVFPRHEAMGTTLTDSWSVRARVV